MAGRPPNPIDESIYSGRFAANLRRLREKSGRSVEQCAEVAGVSSSTWWRWEQGAASPAIDSLPKIAQAVKKLGVRGIMP